MSDLIDVYSTSAIGGSFWAYMVRVGPTKGDSANEGHGDSNLASVMLEYGQPNPYPPTANYKQTISDSYDGTITGASGALMTNAYAPNGDPLTASQVTADPGNPQAVGREVTVNADGSYSYTPAEGFVGTDWVTAELTDSLTGKVSGYESFFVNVAAPAIELVPTQRNIEIDVTHGAVMAKSLSLADKNGNNIGGMIVGVATALNAGPPPTPVNFFSAINSAPFINGMVKYDLQVNGAPPKGLYTLSMKLTATGGLTVKNCYITVNVV